LSSDSVLHGETIPDELLEVIDELDFTDELEDFAELLNATDDDDCATELLDLVLLLDTLVSLLLDCGVTLLLEDTTELLDTSEELVPSAGSGTLEEQDPIASLQDDEEETFEEFTHLPS
jgi:hypothetical protein